MRHLNQTWRLSLAIASLIAVFLGLFVLMARQDFARDKTKTLLEEQRRQLDGASKLFARDLEQALFDAHAVLGGEGPVHPSAQKLFWENARLLAIEWTPTHGDGVMLEKRAGLIVAARALDVGVKLGVLALGGDRFVAGVAEPEGALRVVFEAEPFLPEPARGQVLALSQRGRLVKRTRDAHLNDRALASFLKRATKLTSAQRRIGRHHYVISVSPIAGGLTLSALTPLAGAMSPLNALFYRSLLFLVCAGALSLAFAMIVGRRLQEAWATRVELETNAYRAEADRNAAVAATRDGVNSLRDNLFPSSPHYRNGRIHLRGPENGARPGHWYFYFQHEFDLYVLTAVTTTDALGSILLSASRALVASLPGRSLNSIARAWDRSVSECSNGRGRVSAQIVRVNVELGEGRLIRCGADAVLLERSGRAPEDVGGEANARLGEGHDLWLEEEFQLAAGEALRLENVRLEFGTINGVRPAPTARSLRLAN